MNAFRHSTQPMLWLLLGFAPLAALAAQGKPATRDIAHTLVVGSADVRPGERVLITGSPRDMTLLGDIAIEVMKAGGEAMVTVWSDTLARRSYDDVPAKYDSTPPALAIGLADLFQTQIAVDIGESEDLFAGVPDSRQAARSAAGQPATEEFRKKGTRFVNLGNGLYPTPTLARRLGVSFQDLENNFWRGVGVNPAAIKANGEKLRAAFAAGTSVSITHPNGTSLTFQVTGRSPAISDGSLGRGALAAGVAPSTWLPAGEFLITPVPGTAEGKIVIDRILWNGTVISGLTVTVSKGKIVQLSAAANLQPLQSRYNAGGAGKDVFAGIDIGFNPDVSLPLNSGAIVYMVPGAVTLFFGDNSFFGGENRSDFSFSGQQGGTTLKIDGKPIIVNGRLQ